MLKERAQVNIDLEHNENSRPAFILGVGDQVYVDADAAEYKPNALLWGERSEKIRCAANYLGECFDEVYRAILPYHRLMMPSDTCPAR